MSRGPQSLQLSLVSHTNVGKTTLARTLLGRDVGEVRDAPHVTEFADAYEMLRTRRGETLRLWDTPGFGDSVRLLQRMQQSGNPLGWFLSQVWDRWRDRPFWASQQALRHVARPPTSCSIWSAPPRSRRPPPTWPARWRCCAGSASR